MQSLEHQAIRMANVWGMKQQKRRGMKKEGSHRLSTVLWTLQWKLEMNSEKT
jgi:hypothetical protein